MADQAGNTLSTANTRAFRTISTRATRISDLVDRSDRNDYYRLRLRSRTTLDIDLDRLRDNAHLQLLNSSGRSLFRSARSGRQSETIDRTLDAGTYYLRVYPATTSVRTTYRLSVAGRPDNAGDTRPTARQLDLSDGPVAPRDYIGPGDKTDYYRFDLEDFADVDIRLSRLSASARAFLRDADGSRIASLSSPDANGDASKAGPLVRTLAAGTYYIQVAPRGSTAATDYQIRVAATPPPDNAGNTLAVATALPGGALPIQGNRSVNEFLGQSDTDVYSFVAAPRGNSKASFTLKGFNGEDLSGIDLDLEVFNSAFTSIAENVNASTGNVTLNNVNLTAGETYYVRVSKINNNASTFFQLNIATEANIEDRAPQTPETAFNINNEASWNSVNGLRGPFVTTDFVGAGIDVDDYYRFNISESSFIELTVTPDQDDLTATADIQFFKRVGGVLQQIDTVVQSSNNPEKIEGVFEPGEYFIRVFPDVNESNTFAFYDLSLKATSVSRIPAFIKDINPGEGASSSSNQRMAGVGGSLFFAANDGTGLALWKTDGTLDGTSKLQNFNAIGDMVAVNGFVYFSATGNNGLGEELWRTDGTTVEFVRDIFTGASSSGISSFTVVGNSLYFSATNFSDAFDDNTEVWVVNTAFVGPLADSVTQLNVTPGNAGSSPTNLTAVGNKLYFLTGAGELYKSVSGGAATLVNRGTTQILGSLVEFNNTLYFRGNRADVGREIFRLNATTDAIETIDEVVAAADGNVNAVGFSNLTKVGNKLFFSASVSGTGAVGTELYVFDPSLGSDQTRLVRNINSTGDVTANSNPSNLTEANGLLYFSAIDDATGQSNLWVSNGTQAGTTKVLFGGASIANPGDLTSVNDVLYFTSNDGVNGKELWRIFPGQTPELVNISGDVESQPSSLTVVNGRLFFRADTAEAGRELWVVGLPDDEVV